MSEATRVTNDFFLTVSPDDVHIGIINQLPRSVGFFAPLVFSQKHLNYSGEISTDSALLRVVVFQTLGGQHWAGDLPRVSEVFGIESPGVATEVAPSFVKISDRHFFDTITFSHRHRLSRNMSYQVASVGDKMIVRNGAMYVAVMSDVPCNVHLWSRLDGFVGTVAEDF